MMKKLIISIFIILLCVCQSSAWVLTPIIGGGSAADPCVTMGASGTYELWLNGEYSGDADKACINSGDSTADPTGISAGVAVAGGAINGSSGFLIDADGEYALYTSTSQTIDTDGTIVFNVTTPATLHNQALAEIYTDANNYITIYIATSSLRGTQDGGGAGQQYIGDADCDVSTSTTYAVIYTWQKTGTDTHSISIDGGSTWCDTDAETLQEFTGTTDDFGIGESQKFPGYGGENAYKIDDVIFREGYEGP